VSSIIFEVERLDCWKTDYRWMSRTIDCSDSNNNLTLTTPGNGDLGAIGWANAIRSYECAWIDGSPSEE